MSQNTHSFQPSLSFAQFKFEKAFKVKSVDKIKIRFLFQS